MLEKHLHGKRKSVRYPLSALTYAEFIAANQQKHVERYISRDISITGIFVNALEPLPEGTELIMTIYLDGASGVKLEASGEVVRSEDLGMAISFNYLNQVFSEKNKIMF